MEHRIIPAHQTNLFIAAMATLSATAVSAAVQVEPASQTEHARQHKHAQMEHLTAPVHQAYQCTVQMVH